MTATEKAISAILEEKKCAFCAYRAECRKTCGVMFGFCNTDFCADADRVKKAVLLAKRLADFAREWNTWDYRDAMEEAGGLSAMIQRDAESLLSGDLGIAEWLEECAEEQEDADGLDDYDHLGKRAKKLAREARVFCAGRVSAFCGDAPEEEPEKAVLPINRIATKTETFCAPYNGKLYCVDICEDAEDRTAWIYNVQYGVKMLMWGEMASNDRDTFCGLVFKNIPEYADMYAEEYED